MKIIPDVAYNLWSIEEAEQWLDIAKKQSLNNGKKLTPDHWAQKGNRTCFYYSSSYNSCYFESATHFIHQGYDVLIFKNHKPK